jgi:uncharacterized protein with PhoU and TrkA domain
MGSFIKRKKERRIVNEQIIYEMAYTICKIIEEKWRLEERVKHLEKQLDFYDKEMKKRVEEDKKFIGDLFVSMISNATNRLK